MSFRPALLGKNSAYAISDPGYEYIPGVSGVFFGPLADRWRVGEKEATPEQRANLYNGVMPNGRWAFVRPEHAEKYRPVHGGSFHAPKTLDLWLTKQPDATRAKVERIFAKAAAEVVREKIIPDVTSRIGHAGAKKIQVEGMAVGFVHKEASGFYHLHYLVEIHNVGMGPDGTLRAVDNKFLFDRQGTYGVEFQAKLAHSLYRECGLKLRPVGNSVELKGLEELREVKTPRQEQMAAELESKGIPATPKSLDYAARKTHSPRDPEQTLGDILRRTRIWITARGIDVKQAVIEPVRKFSRWWESCKAESSIKAAVKAVDRVGKHVSFDDVSRLALRKGAQRQADPRLINELLFDVQQQPREHGLVQLDRGIYTTPRIEASRVRWEMELGRLGRRAPRLPSTLARDRLRLSHKPPSHERENATRNLHRRVAFVDRPSDLLKLALDTYRADDRRVFAAASDHTRLRVRRELDIGVTSPNELAKRLGKTSLKETFFELRRHRWRSSAHVEALYHRARKPQLTLGRDDVLMIDARHANHHALAVIARAARQAGASVILIKPDAPPARQQVQHREDPNRDR